MLLTANIFYISCGIFSCYLEILTTWTLKQPFSTLVLLNNVFNWLMLKEIENIMTLISIRPRFYDAKGVARIWTCTVAT